MSDNKTTDADLVEGAVREAGKHGNYRGHPLWRIVSYLFDCRPSEAKALCARFGRDPNEVPQA